MSSQEEFENQAGRNDPYEFEGEEELVAAMNTKCAVAPFGNEMRFVFWDKEGAPVFLRERDAKIKVAQYRLCYEAGTDEKPKLKTLPGFKVWVESRDRREFSRVVFNPKQEAVAPDELNLWTGFAVEPGEGDWSLLRAHIRENICQGNETHFRFLMAWMAQMFQEPWRKSGVAIVLRGEFGVGKSKLAEWITRVVGPRHAVVADKSQQVTGRFNAQLRYNLFLSAEESFFAGDPQMKGPLKHLITAPVMSYEAKGIDITQGANFTRVFITTNELWAYPAASGERRLLVLDVGNKRAKDGPYFAAIDAQMEQGGAAAMLYDLLRYDYSGINFQKPPMTAALSDQIRHGFSGQLRWLESVLCGGCLPFRDGLERAGTELAEVETLIPKRDVESSYGDYVQGFRSRPATPEEVGSFLAKHIPGLRQTRPTVAGQRVRHYIFPPLGHMRDAFLKMNPGYEFPLAPIADDPVTACETAELSSSAVVPLRRRA